MEGFQQAMMMEGKDIPVDICNRTGRDIMTVFYDGLRVSGLLVSMTWNSKLLSQVKIMFTSTDSVNMMPQAGRRESNTILLL